MSDDKNDGVLRFLYMNNLKLALEYLDGVISESGIDPRECGKFVLQHTSGELAGYILIGAIRTVDLSFVPGGIPAVAIEINSLMDEELNEVNAMDQVGQAKGEEEEPRSPEESDFIQDDGSAKKKKQTVN